jgi:hypothetical protein
MVHNLLKGGQMKTDFTVLTKITCEVIKEFFNLTDQIKLSLINLEEKELKQLIHTTKKTNSFNCSWLTYELAPLVRHYAEKELRGRE